MWIAIADIAKAFLKHGHPNHALAAVVILAASGIAIAGLLSI